jgi:hypothetical protein
MAGQSIAAVIPAILPVAETNANMAEEMLFSAGKLEVDRVQSPRYR